MSLQVSVSTPGSIWTLIDRQLVAEQTSSLTDGCNVVGIDSTDGIALLSYTGGVTFGDEDPGDWMAGIFEGLDTDLRGYMLALLRAAKSAVPARAREAEPGHLFVATGVADGEPVTYTLSTAANDELRLVRHEASHAFMLAGPGGVALASAELADEARQVLEQIADVEADDAHPREVADRLSKWVRRARRSCDEVGQRSVVAYRLTRDRNAAVGRCFYNDGQLEPPDAQLHHISRGADVQKMLELMKKEAMGATLSIRETAQLFSYKRRQAES